MTKKSICSPTDFLYVTAVITRLDLKRFVKLLEALLKNAVVCDLIWFYGSVPNLTPIIKRELLSLIFIV